ncbi:hypothetical protein EWM64_g8703 [Hericium alpestre]|uniref:Uncharacterized protein n=1 Tax=Hericium alpestre TaxID=135208 RepID=A0A4Y9ZPF3_9AGAM|nr:hypothetical protein EWM64_g8703 [Hericium alpestre]
MLRIVLPTPEPLTQHTPVKESPLIPLFTPATPTQSLSLSLSPSPTHICQYSSNSDYSFAPHHLLNMPKPGVNMATFSQDAIIKLPILSAGKISPEMLTSWDDSTRGYFAHKNIKDTDQVCLISYSFQDPRIRQWICLKQTELFALTYDDFLAQGLTPFTAWHLNMQSHNALLIDMPAHLSDDVLQRKLESGVHDDVATVLHHKDYSSLSFSDWLDKVTVIDDECIVLETHVSAEAAILHHHAELSCTTPLSSASHIANCGPP